jgi:predicted RNA-binding Zn ribbon-like protein
LIAGPAVLDLVNTISWRGAPERQQDHLASAEDCLVWALRAEVITPDERESLQVRVDQDPKAAEALVGGLHRLRQTIAEFVGRTWPAGSPDEVRAAIIEALAHSDLIAAPAEAGGDPGRPPGYRWTVRDVDEHTARRRLALDLESLLTTPLGRIGVCADEECQWIFLDTSRAQNRRWCSSADCGNRHRVQQHHRRRARSAAPS